ncbi:MAG: AzlD domain-containing protein [Clostridia bacterium]|nr:AzlD domain-containing protein [Clostridia bacterium]
MNNLYLICAVITMALITYFIRLLPLTFFRKKITNPYIKSFLNFVPYAVLGAMTIPDAFFATGSIISAGFGIATALFLSLKGKGLLSVSLISCLVVLILNSILFQILP